MIASALRSRAFRGGAAILLLVTLLFPIPAVGGSFPHPLADDGDCAESLPDGVIAVVGEEEIAVEEVERWVAPVLAELEAERRERRFALVSGAVRDHLLDREATRRGIDRETLLAREVHDRVGTPTELELVATLHRAPEFYGDDLAAARERLVADWRRERAVRIGTEFVDRLVESASVEGVIDVAAAGADLSGEVPIAIVDGIPIAFATIAGPWQDLEYELALAAYEERRARLDVLIDTRLLERAARESGRTPRAIWEARVRDRQVAITDEEVESFHRANESRIVGSLEETREAIREHLTLVRQRDLERALALDLRDAVDLRTTLPRPEPPIQGIETAGRPSIGPPDAPVTVVKFTDLQCARCRDVFRTLEEVVDSSRGRVRVVFFHEPLVTLHPLASLGALSAEAARAQGAFEPFVDAVFRAQETLTEGSFESIAVELGLDRTRFLADRAGRETAARIAEDRAEADRLGLDRTPVVFVDGRRVRDKSRAGIRAAVERALHRHGLGDVPLDDEE